MDYNALKTLLKNMALFHGGIEGTRNEFIALFDAMNLAKNDKVVFEGGDDGGFDYFEIIVKREDGTEETVYES